MDLPIALGTTTSPDIEVPTVIRISQSTEAALFALEGPEARVRDASAVFADLLGLAAEQLAGRPLLELVHADDLEDVRAALAAAEAGEAEVGAECRFVPRDGGGVHLQWLARTTPGSDVTRVAARDQTQLDRHAAERADLRVRLALALGPPAAALWSLDVRSGRLTWDARAAEVLGTGVRRLPVTALELAATLAAEDAPVLLAAVDRLLATGETAADVRVEQGAGHRQLALRGRVVAADRRGRPLHAAGLLLDVTAERAVEEQMVRMSTSGTLAGVPNRRAFDTALRGEWRRCTRGFEPMSIIVIDLDDFAALNSRYGHRIGDDALGAVARALTRSLHRAGDLLARFGGQEFAIVLPGIDESGALAVGQRLVEAVRGVTLDEAPDWRLSVSVGTSTWVPGCETSSAEDLLRQACDALYGAKGAGKDRVVLTLPDSPAGPTSDSQAPETPPGLED